MIRINEIALSHQEDENTSKKNAEKMHKINVKII